MDEDLPLTIEVTIPDYRTAGEGKNEHTVKLSYGIGLTWRLVTLTNNSARFSYDVVVVTHMPKQVLPFYKITSPFPTKTP